MVWLLLVDMVDRQLNMQQSQEQEEGIYSKEKIIRTEYVYVRSTKMYAKMNDVKTYVSMTKALFTGSTL